jgi:hypothetical protein
LAVLAAALAACSSSTAPSSVTGTWVETNTGSPLTFDLIQSGNALSGTDVSLGDPLTGSYDAPQITFNVTISGGAFGTSITYAGRLLSNTEMKLSIGNAGDSVDFVKQ